MRGSTLAWTAFRLLLLPLGWISFAVRWDPIAVAVAVQAWCAILFLYARFHSLATTRHKNA